MKAIEIKGDRLAWSDTPAPSLGEGEVRIEARPVAAKAAVMSALRERVWPLVESGGIAPVIDGVVPIAETGRAHEPVESNETLGKVVLSVD